MSNARPSAFPTPGALEAGIVLKTFSGPEKIALRDISDVEVEAFRPEGKAPGVLIASCMHFEKRAAER
jgi:hypothetical protein